MSDKKVATIRDIARQAGVSISTVSRVLNGTTPVASHKQAAVQEAIHILKYRPNIEAQNLVRGRTMAIGVVTQDVGSPFYGSLLSGIDQGLRGSHYHPVFANANWEIGAELEALDLILSRRVAGLVILGGSVAEDKLQEVAERVPLILVGRMVAGLEDQCLLLNNFEGAYQATRHLLDLGHQRIAHITGIPTLNDAMERRAGYCKALEDRGIPVDPRLIVEGDFQETSGLLGIEMLLMRGALFTAVFVGNDQMAMGARLALYRRGIRVPQDISLVGFDDQIGSAYSVPPLTTVYQPNFEMGKAAAQSVLRMIEGNEPDLPDFSIDLILRESTRALSMATL